MPLVKPSSSEFPLPPHPHLYEINTWAWLEQLSARLSRPAALDDVPDEEWDTLARLGFHIIWLMGVWQRSPESKRIALADLANHALYDRALPGWKPSDVVGSPYAVAQYVPDPRIGTWDSLDRVREKLHALGMALFLDFVGNHTALDHPWTREHPEFYVQGTQQDFEKDPTGFFRVEGAAGTAFLAHGRDPYFSPWTDTAQLNHFSPQMRAAYLAGLRTVASHCDGVRCDMAMLQFNDIFASIWGPYLKGAQPPATEFWAEAHETTPALTLLAEAYWGTEQRLLDFGFSYAYDKVIYDAVRDAKPADVRARLSGNTDFEKRLARFLENHDEDRCAAVFGQQRLPAAGTLMGTLPGMRFYHQGELDGLETRLPITLRMAADVPPDPVISDFFQKILGITHDDVFHKGQWSLLPVTAEGDATSGNLIAYEWRSEAAWKVVAVNLAGYASQGRVQLGDRVSPEKLYTFYDELDDIRYVRDGAELRGVGLFVRRDGFQAHLFDVTFG